MHRRPQIQSLADPKASINLRIEARSRCLIDDTAFVLDDAEFNSFVAVLENLPAHGPKLRALIQRIPAWAG